MRVDVLLTPQELHHAPLQDKTVVVIDVLRATTTIVTALENGARSVWPVAEVEAARQLVATWPDPVRPLLAGERGGQAPPGFDLGNSPREFTPQVVADRDIVLTTTNGTRALEAAREAAEVRVACLRNGAAAAEACLRSGRDVLLACSGTQGRFSLEDAACAAHLLEELAARRQDLEEGDGARLVWGWFQSVTGGKGEPHWTALLGETVHGHRLRRLGFAEDIDFCAQTNVSPVIPLFRDGRLVADQV